jgi:hypothetical protein
VSDRRIGGPADARILRPWWEGERPPWATFDPRLPGILTRGERDPDLTRDDDCRRFLEELRARFDAQHSGYRPGELAEPITLDENLFRCLWRDALARPGVVGGWFVWQNLDSEAAVHVQESRVALREGLVIAGLRMRCEEIDESELVVPLAAGTEKEPSGMVLVTETAARGHALLVEVWGEVAVASCWLALVEVARTVSAAAGEDRECLPLLPGAIYAGDGALTVIPQARHAIDLGARS